MVAPDLAPIGGWPTPSDPQVARSFAALAEHAKEFYLERQSILIVDGGWTPLDAEREALRLTCAYFGLVR